MALAWISGAFQRFVGFLTGNQPEEDIAPSSARREMAPGSSTIGSYSPEEVEAAHGELFDNEYRRKAQEHARLRAECFKKADEARKSGDHATANDYVNQVSRWEALTHLILCVISIGYTPRARLLNHWATRPEVCNQLVL